MDRTKAPLYIFILIAGLAVSFLAVRERFSIQAVGLLIFLLIFLPTIINPGIGLVIMIVSMIYSPEIIMGKTMAREIAIRAEDILLMVIIFAWFIKTSFTKDIRSAFKTEITTPFLLYIAACVLSTLFAIIFSEIDIKQSFFSIVKYLEYFLLFVMVKDILKDIRQSKLFVAVFLLVALLAATHSNIYIKKQLEMKTGFFRVAPPIETRGGQESGTMGGYLLFMMAIAGGLLIYTRSVPVRVFLICLELAMIRAFLYTLSRGSYLAIIPTAAALVYFTARNKFILIYTLIIGSVLIALFMPQMIRDRIFTTVVVKESFSGHRVEWEDSPRARLESWKLVLFERFPRSPLFGYGVARYFIDGQLFLTLCEVGLVGLYLLARVLRMLFKAAKNIISLPMIKDDDFSAGLSLGFLSGFVGILIHSISTNTFIVIKTMEPFWFIAAIVLSLPRLLEQEEAAKAAAGVS